MSWCDMNYKLRSSFVGAFFVTVCTLVALIFIGDSAKDYAISGMVAITAAILGWAVGIGISPYSTGEKTNFDKYAKVVATFGSGYLLAKIDPLVTHIMSPDVIFAPLVGFRILLGVSAFLLLVILVYVFRQYG